MLVAYHMLGQTRPLLSHMLQRINDIQLEIARSCSNLN